MSIHLFIFSYLKEKDNYQIMIRSFILKRREKRIKSERHNLIAVGVLLRHVSIVFDEMTKLFGTRFYDKHFLIRKEQSNLVANATKRASQSQLNCSSCKLCVLHSKLDFETMALSDLVQNCFECMNQWMMDIEFFGIY